VCERDREERDTNVYVYVRVALGGCDYGKVDGCSTTATTKILSKMIVPSKEKKEVKNSLLKTIDFLKPHFPKMTPAQQVDMLLSLARTMACFNEAWVYHPIKKEVVRLSSIPFQSDQSVRPVSAEFTLPGGAQLDNWTGVKILDTTEHEYKTDVGSVVQLTKANAHAFGFLANDGKTQTVMCETDKCCAIFESTFPHSKKRTKSCRPQAGCNQRDLEETGDSTGQP
jgi:hypothetical protein